jgi:regulator of PEP synthase PpsR (kinase-PPPase family)
MSYHIIRIPFIDSIEKALTLVDKINSANHHSKPILFTTLVNQQISTIVHTSNAFIVDLFQAFVQPLEQELRLKSSHAINRSHQIGNIETYEKRIEAINFALGHDDGQSHTNLAQADIILVGVSRSGKTPTSLYLAMQHGLKAANYPLIPEDFERLELPSILLKFKDKLFGLTIDPNRLSDIRHERKPHSVYASLQNCRYEVLEAEKLMRRHNIECLSTTHKSIEEIATTILQRIFG